MMHSAAGLYRCVAPEPVLCRGGDENRPAGVDQAAARAGPRLSGEKVAAGSLIWPGQVVKGRERAASSWVGGDGKAILRPRRLEILDGGGCWLPICEEPEEEEEEGFDLKVCMKSVIFSMRSNICGLFWADFGRFGRRISGCFDQWGARGARGWPRRSPLISGTNFIFLMQT